jgi:branched-chain amino acid transport system permease protein
MTNLILFSILGIGAGSIYALLGTGLVLVHKASGVINFAQGAIAAAGAYVYVWLGSDGVPRYLALILTLIIAGIFGILLHFAIFGPLRNAPPLARLVASLGVLLSLQAGISIVFGVHTKTATPVLPTSSIVVGSVAFGQDRIWLLGIAISLSFALWAVFRFTRFGKLTRAIAENEKGAMILGYSTDVVAAASWALACVLATLGGILIAPITSLDPTTYTLFVIPALAAALVARFSSFGIVTLAGCAIGVLGSLVTGGVIRVWPSVIPPQGVVDSVPFLVIVVALALGGRLPARGSLTEGRLPYAPRRRRRSWAFTYVSLVFWLGIAIVATALLQGDRSYQSAIATGLIFALLGFSIVLVTGLVGQISLAQLAFAGLGAFCAAKLGTGVGLSFLPTIILSALIAGVIGLLVGLPALRLRGLQLAIMTLGAAVCIQSVVFQNARWGGGVAGLTVPIPSIFGWSLDSQTHPTRFVVVVVVIIAIVYIAVSTLWAGTFGRKMNSVRENERAALSAGINVRFIKLSGFTIGAIIAGLAGGLYGYQNQALAFDAFSPIQSISFFALVYIAGVGYLGGTGVFVTFAATGGVVWVFINHVGINPGWQGLVAGVALILTPLLDPDGFTLGIEQKLSFIRSSYRRMLRRSHATVSAGLTNMSLDVDIVAGPALSKDVKPEVHTRN